MAYLRISPGYGGNCGVELEVRCLGETGSEYGAKAEEEDKTAGDSYGLRIAADDWENFVSAFGEDNRQIGKEPQ
jgi:hypothetical protein